MITAKQIRKSKSAFETMMKANRTGQLSENCSIFELKNYIGFSKVIVNVSLIKNKPIPNNSSFDVSVPQQSLMNIFKLVDKVPYTTNSKELVRLFTVEPTSIDAKDILAYFVSAHYTL